MTDVYVLDAVRTPFGKYGGALSEVRPDDLAAHVIKALIERVPELEGGDVEEILLGNANGAGEENRNVARMAALLAGLPPPFPERPSTACAAPAWRRPSRPPARFRPVMPHWRWPGEWSP